MSLLKSTLRIGLAIGLVVTIYNVFAAPHNGFDLSNSSIDTNEIMHGGPDKDGIPAIDNPRFVKPDKAIHLQPNDRILGIQLGDVSKAYPIGILNWHEIVNDEIKGQNFSITYCPLCGTGVAFASQVADKSLDFGVSGLLYNSDVLLYDRQTESLWSQILSTSISGPMQGNKLKRLPITHTSWKNWVNDHPNTLVLSDKTGYSRDYRRDPYDGYEKSRTTYFRVTNEAPPNYHPKERVLGLEINNQFKAYPFAEIDKAGSQKIHDEFAGQKITIDWDQDNRKANLSDANGDQLPVIEGFWFAWFAFHPETEVYKSSE